MSSEEMMNWNVPFPRKFKPVGTVPPIAVEVSVGETSNLRECSKHKLENNEKDKEKCDHEWEQQHTYAFCKDERYL